MSTVKTTREANGAVTRCVIKTTTKGNKTTVTRRCVTTNSKRKGK